MNIVQHYNHEKYWKMRQKAIEGKSFLKYYYLFRVKKMDAFNGASFGTHIGYGAEFKGSLPPQFPHGIKGIFVSHNAVIGANARIYQQVTIGEGTGGAPIIGDNVFIGAGAKIIGKINIGNNVKIGANCVVCEDVPDNCTVVLNKPRIIQRSN